MSDLTAHTTDSEFETLTLSKAAYAIFVVLPFFLELMSIEEFVSGFSERGGDVFGRVAIAVLRVISWPIGGLEEGDR